MNDIVNGFEHLSETEHVAVIAETMALEISQQMLIHFYSTPHATRTASPEAALQAALNAAMAKRGAECPRDEADIQGLAVAFDWLNAHASAPARRLYQARREAQR